MVIGDSGIFKKAQNAKEETLKSQAYENLKLKILETQAENNGEATYKDIIMKLKDDPYWTYIIESYENQTAKLSKKGVITDSNISTIDFSKINKISLIINEIFKYEISGTDFKIDYKGKTDGSDIPEPTIPSIKQQDIEVTLNPDASVLYTKQNVTAKIQLNREDISDYTIQYKYDKDGSVWTDYNDLIDIDKNVAFAIKIIDSSNRDLYVSSTAFNVNYIDKLKPNTPTSSIEKTTNKLTVKTSATDQAETDDYICSGIAGYSYSIDGEDWTSYKGDTHTFEKLTQNTDHTIKVKAIDNAGNESEEETLSTSTKKMPDLQSGAVEISLDTSTNNVIAGPINATLIKNIDLSEFTIKYSLDGTIWTEYNDENIPISKNCVLVVKAYDEEKQESTVATMQIDFIDTLNPNKPTISSKTSTENSITLTVSATDPKDSYNCSSGIAGYSFSVNDGAWTSYQSSGTYTKTGLSTGTTYTVKVKAKDNVGNESEVQTTTITTTKVVSFSNGYSLSGSGSGSSSESYYIAGTYAELPKGATVYYVINASVSGNAGASVSVAFESNTSTTLWTYYTDGSYKAGQYTCAESGKYTFTLRRRK